MSTQDSIQNRHAQAIANMLARDLDPVERDVLEAVGLATLDPGMPTTQDGRLAREAFGRDAQKTILKARKTGARVREERYTQTCDGDGAPTRIVYDALVYAGLLRPRPGKLRWTLTPMGHAALQFV